MIVITGDNIISALGFTSEENYLNFRRGKSGLRFHKSLFHLEEPVVASAVNNRLLNFHFTKLAEAYNNHKNYTHLEKMAIVSIADALKQSKTDMKSKKVQLFLSTTKGNIFLLGSKHNRYPSSASTLAGTAERIAGFFGNETEPVVISNACTSGICALIAARRAVMSKRIDTAVVVGTDMLSHFVTSGFQSFKALSSEPCKPFDKERKGLNLGEAAATMILQNKRENKTAKNSVCLEAGAISNDANHISGPSRTGEGLFLALQSCLQGFKPEQIAIVNAHGTATAYNDEMESIALTRAGLTKVPVNALKGYLGHTLGAAGILESIITMRSLREGLLLPTKGFNVSGVTYPIDIVKEPRHTDKSYALKMLSGFGGCNAVMLFSIHHDTK